MKDIEAMFEQAKTLVRSIKFPPSASFLQREMRIGYPAAANLIEIMIEEGVLERDAKNPWKLRVI